MKILEWAKEAKVGLVILALAVAGLASLNACSGYTVKDFVKYQNPPGVQEALNVPATQTLRQAEFTVAEWELYVTKNTAALMENVGNAEQMAGFIGGIVTGGLNLLLESEEIQTSIFGGLLALAVGTVGGIFFPAPGTGKRIQKEKEESFNAGQRKAQALLTTTKDIING